MGFMASTFLLFPLLLMVISIILVSTEDSKEKAGISSTLMPVPPNPHKKNRALLMKSENKVRRLKFSKKHRVAKYQIRKREMQKASRSSNKSSVNMKKSKPKFRWKMARKIRKPQSKAKDSMQNDETKLSDQPEGGIKSRNNSLSTLKKQSRSIVKIQSNTNAMQNSEKKIRPRAKKSRRRSNNKLVKLRKKTKISKTNDTGEKLKAASEVKIGTDKSSKRNEPINRTVLKSSVKDGYMEELHSKSTGERLYRDEYGHIQHNGCWYKTGEEFLETRDIFNKKPRICKSKAEVVGDRKKPDEARFINEYGDLVVKQPGGLVHVAGQPYKYGYGQYLSRKRTMSDIEAQKKRIRMHGGNPDKLTFEQMCVKEEHGFCYHEGPKHCVKRDWAKKCLKWYILPQRYDGSGKLVTLRPLWDTDSETPYNFDKRPHYKSGRDKICIIGRVRRIRGKPNTQNRCVSFPKMFHAYPHLAKQLEAEFPKALPKSHPNLRTADQNRYRNGRYLKMNEKLFQGTEDALSIIEKIINGANDPQCEWIGGVFPFLRPHFKEFTEQCTL